MRKFTSILMAAGLLASAMLPAMASNQGIPPGGKNKDCHGYVRHVSVNNIRVHCIDGVPADLSFLSVPVVSLPGGNTMNTRDLKPNTPVHVIFTQSLGIRHAFKIYVAKPNGHGLYGFKA
ncbi:MAG: hypothetical protein M3126_04760 [Candidatus Eremiobacteraeota bacterium]|nr:hypothetical protein [Candidatus Eremiobacteraeota bacterium]